MTPFEDLTYRGQLRRLRQLALEALASYDLGDFTLRPIQHRENATFLVRAGGCRYVLRVSRPGCKTQSAIRSELEWMDAIARDTDLVVRAPVVNREGQLLTVASTPGVPEPRVCALFRWVKGRFVSQHDLTGRHLVMVGRLMGRLHDHAAGFVPSSGFTRIGLGRRGTARRGQGLHAGRRQRIAGSRNGGPSSTGPKRSRAA